MKILLIFSTALLLLSCSPNKLVSKGNTFYELQETVTGVGSTFHIIEKKANHSFRAEIEETSDQIIIKPKCTPSVAIISSQAGDPAKINLKLVGKYYFSETDSRFTKIKSFTYYDIKFGLQALSIPLKLRKSVGDDVLNPPTVETGFTVGFAPGWKFTRNTYSSSKNYLGKNISQFAIAIGSHFGVGASDLKKASNAPGLVSDRKAAMFTCGGFLLFGFNNINLGIGIGKDYVLGEGRKNWVYQGETWTGVIISLDILKF